PRRIPSPLPATSRWFEATVRPVTPLSRTMVIRSVGIPHRPNPPTAMVMPSRSTAVSCAATSSETLDIAVPPVDWSSLASVGGDADGGGGSAPSLVPPGRAAPRNRGRRRPTGRRGTTTVRSEPRAPCLAFGARAHGSADPTDRRTGREPGHHACWTDRIRRRHLRPDLRAVPRAQGGPRL